MIKAIHLPSAVIGSITAKSKNNGVSFRVSTPELSRDERGVIFDLQDIVCDMLIQPQDEEFPEIVETKSEVERKTASSRLRGALYVLHQKSGSDTEFSTYYAQQMQKIIDKVKEKIQEYED
jgi:hypothetical protein